MERRNCAPRDCNVNLSLPWRSDIAEDFSTIENMRYEIIAWDDTSQFKSADFFWLDKDVKRYALCSNAHLYQQTSLSEKY